MKVTISMPCFGRPQRTIRAIECIANQTINGWEALVVGDGCSVTQDFIFSNYFSDIVRDANARGNDLRISNNSENKGGSGYYITNQNIQRAKGEYFVFYANDDVIMPNHLENYLSEIDGTDYDFIYFDSYVEPYGGIRDTTLRYGGIGHSEIIAKTDFLRTMPPHNAEYGHDWHLIEAMANSGKNKKAVNKPYTYIVKSVPAKKEEGID